MERTPRRVHWSPVLVSYAPEQLFLPRATSTPIPLCGTGAPLQREADAAQPQVEANETRPRPLLPARARHSDVAVVMLTVLFVLVAVLLIAALLSALFI